MCIARRHGGERRPYIRIQARRRRVSRMTTPTTTPPPTDPAAPPQFKRVLRLPDLVIYGLVLIQPIAPVGIFGLAQQMSHGHVSTTILIAMVAMSLTAISYGRMATLYPSAGRSE